MPVRPTSNLSDARRPLLRDLFVALRSILVDDLPPLQQQPEGHIGVLGERIRAPTSYACQRLAANAADRPAVLRHESEIHSRLLVDLISAGALQVEQPRQEAAIHIVWDDAPHHRANLRIEEWRHQLLQQLRSGNVVRVKEEVNFTPVARAHFRQRGRLAGLAAGPENGTHQARVAFGVRPQQITGSIRGSVIDRNDR